MRKLAYRVVFGVVFLGGGFGLVHLSNFASVHGWVITVPALMLITLWVILGLFITYRLKNSVLPNLLGHVLVATLMVVGVDLAARVSSQQIVFSFSAQSLNSYLFDKNDEVFGSGGNVVHYKPHPFMAFALNPSSKYYGEYQFNSDYLIRRKEKPKSRQKVRWRALVLGGSTTFDEAISREEDTWVYLTEASLRERYSNTIEIINGGVGGYTILENFIHYATLLTELDPDVVILFAGGNDAHPRFYGSIKYDYRNYRKAWSGPQINLQPTQPPLSWIGSYRLFRVIRDIVPAKTKHLWDFVSYEYPSQAQREINANMNSTLTYQAHLENLVRFLLAQGKEVIIIPQIALQKDDIPADGSNTAAFVKMIEDNNKVNLHIAKSLNVNYLADVQGKFLSSDMGDAVHFKNRGSARMASIVAEYLATNRFVEHVGSPLTQATLRAH